MLPVLFRHHASGCLTPAATIALPAVCDRLAALTQPAIHASHQDAVPIIRAAPHQAVADPTSHPSTSRTFSTSRSAQSSSSDREASMEDLLDSEDREHKIFAGNRRGRALGALARTHKFWQEGVEQLAAKEVMRDPMSQIMSSHGMPMGIAYHALKKGNQTPTGVDTDDVSNDSGGTSAAMRESQSAYPMEAMDELFMIPGAKGVHTQAGAHAAEPAPQTASSDASSSGPSGSASGGAGGAAGGRSGDDDAGDTGSDSDSDDSDRASAGGQAQGDSNRRQFVPPSEDSWGTTRESSAEIARRIVESNAELERQASLLADSDPSTLDTAGRATLDNPADEPLEDVQSPGQEKYKTLEQMSSDIKQLDEVFEVLAQVPWLDEDNIQQKELKGVAMVGLLGTLEEVGFNIRHQVERIWSGDHDDGMILECSSAKDQAALISILFHTKKIHEQYGHPDQYLPAPVKRSGAQGGQQPVVSESILQALAGGKLPGKDGDK